MATISTTFLKQNQLNPQHIVFKSWDSNGNQVDYKRADLRYKMSGFAQRLYALGVSQNSKVGILGETTVDLGCVVMAIWALGGTVVHIPLSVRKDLKDSKETCATILSQHEFSFIIVSKDQDFLSLEQILEDAFEPVQLFSLEGKSEEAFPLFAAEVEDGFLERVVFLNADKSVAVSSWKDFEKTLTHSQILEFYLVQSKRELVHGDSVWMSLDVENALGFELLIDAFTANHTLCFGEPNPLSHKMNVSVVLMSAQEISRMLYDYFRERTGMSLVVSKWMFAVAIQSEHPTFKKSKRIGVQKRMLRNGFEQLRETWLNGIKCIGVLNHSDSDNILFMKGIGVSVFSLSKNTFDIKS